MVSNKKKLITAAVAVALVFAFQTLDIFFIHVNGSLFGGNIVARFAGLGVFIAASIVLQFNVKNFCFRRYGAFFELLIGAFFAAASVAVVFAAEYVALTLKGYNYLKPNINLPNTNEYMSLRGKILAVGLFMFTVLLQAVFKELFFRGFLITQLFDKFGLKKSNIIQATLYTLLLVPTIVNFVLTGRFKGYGWEMTAFIIGCNLLIDFISGIKWGLYYRVNGTVWMSVADHFFNNLLLTCLYLTYGMMPMKWYVIQAVLVQAVSFVFFMPLYFSRDRQNEEIAAEVAVRRELAGMRVDNYSPSPLRSYLENKRFEKQVEYAKKRNLPPPKKNIRFPQEFEEPVSLRDSQIFFEAQLAQTMQVFEIRENPDTEKEDAETLETSPSEISKAYFEETTQKSMNTDVNITAGMKDEHAKETGDIDQNENNISKLVKNYFEDNFNKYTFGKKEDFPPKH